MPAKMMQSRQIEDNGQSSLKLYRFEVWLTDDDYVKMEAIMGAKEVTVVSAKGSLVFHTSDVAEDEAGRAYA